MGVSPDKIIYANPCKQRSMLKYARNVDVRLMTADNLVRLSEGALYTSVLNSKSINVCLTKKPTKRTNSAVESCSQS
jgi:diaminopimelate decarboxylase